MLRAPAKLVVQRKGARRTGRELVVVVSSGVVCGGVAKVRGKGGWCWGERKKRGRGWSCARGKEIREIYKKKCL